MSEETVVRFEVNQGCAELVLDRPAQLNAMSPQMVVQLLDGLRAAPRGRPGCCLVSAAGRGFSAGRDIAGAQPGTEDGGQVLAEIFNPMVQKVADLPFPTIAAVQGACLGTGLGPRPGL